MKPTDVHDQPILPKGVIVLGGAHGSLGLIRDLGRQGVPVCFITNDHPLPRFSRYLKCYGAWPGPASDDSLEWLFDYSRQQGLSGWLIIPGGDGEVQWIAMNTEALSPHFRTLTLPWETLQVLCDKKMLYARAEALGLDYPSTYDPAAENSARANWRFPVVLKPAMRLESNRFTLAKAWRADDPQSFARLYDDAVSLVGANGIVVQEMIPGGGESQLSYCALWQDGVELTCMTARRLRQYPVEFGYTSTLVETADIPEAAEAARRVLSSLTYTGLVEVEFKLDKRDGRLAILDVNPRAWSWLALGSAGGVNFGDALWCLASGKPFVASRQTDARWMNSVRDFIAAAHGMSAGTLSFKDYLRAFKSPMAWANFAWDDPIPGLIELPLVLARVVSKRFPASLQPRKR